MFRYVLVSLRFGNGDITWYEYICPTSIPMYTMHVTTVGEKQNKTNKKTQLFIYATQSHHLSGCLIKMLHVWQWNRKENKCFFNRNSFMHSFIWPYTWPESWWTTEIHLNNQFLWDFKISKLETPDHREFFNSLFLSFKNGAALVRTMVTYFSFTHKITKFVFTEVGSSVQPQKISFSVIRVPSL